MYIRTHINSYKQKKRWRLIVHRGNMVQKTKLGSVSNPWIKERQSFWQHDLKQSVRLNCRPTISKPSSKRLASWTLDRHSHTFHLYQYEHAVPVHSWLLQPTPSAHKHKCCTCARQHEDSWRLLWSTGSSYWLFLKKITLSRQLLDSSKSHTQCSWRN